jgi:hypothetical protein
LVVGPAVEGLSCLLQLQGEVGGQSVTHD